MQVNALFAEPGVQLSEAVVRAIQRCADWHGTPEVRLGRLVPKTLLDRLRGDFDRLAPEY